jgi:hypothetical protein
MLNHLMRYVPIVRLIEQERAGERILEVGSGSKGVKLYFPDKTVVAVDVNLDEGDRFASPGCFPVRATAESLPFRDGAFSIVVCVDVLEHIRPERREEVMRELLRVSSRRVYLAFPVRGSCETWESMLFSLHRLCRKEVPGWLREHIDNGLPEEKEVAKFLGANGRILRMVPNENNLVHFIVMLFDEFVWPGNRVGEVMAPQQWKFKEHGLNDNVRRVLLFPFRYLPRVANFGATVRTLFVVEGRGSGAPER